MRAVLSACALALLGACVYAHLRQPELSISDVSLLKGDLFRQQLRVRMHVHNPNDLALPVRGISYEVQVAGHAFAHGDSSSDFIVPANGDADFDVNVTANAAGALLSLLGSGDTASAQYRITGKVELSSGLLRNIPFDHTGTFRLR